MLSSISLMNPEVTPVSGLSRDKCDATPFISLACPIGAAARGESDGTVAATHPRAAGDSHENNH